jgi:hypothetical protein
MRMAKPVFELDGARFDSFAAFCEEISRHLAGGRRWHGNLDAFNDLLRNAFDAPDEGFGLRWKDSERSRQVLGHAETARWLEARLTQVHPSNVPEWRRRIELMRRGEGETLFDTLVEIIRDHGPGGAKAEDGVELELL